MLHISKSYKFHFYEFEIEQMLDLSIFKSLKVCKKHIDQNEFIIFVITTPSFD